MAVLKLALLGEQELSLGLTAALALKEQTSAALSRDQNHLWSMFSMKRNMFFASLQFILSHMNDWRTGEQDMRREFRTVTAVYSYLWVLAVT